ncbi:MAG: glycine cleavage system aminomethyltransferase GcvT [Candidatus Omnitrophica bacterium]|nr:glycine cleavage system aminomethyltransferase GcvT [Candidatus Omnitrophota bacterium]
MNKTPLYEAHVALGAKMAPFGGWLMPIQYEGILAEHAHTRNGVCVFDICHMGEFLIEGDAVKIGLDQIVTQDITSMPEGACRYGFMLNKHGGVIDDLVVYRIKKDSWMLVVNAATIWKDETHLKENLRGEYRFENVSSATGKLDVQGLQSKELLNGIFGENIAKLKYYTFADFIFDKVRCIISRTGYTGELGYEIYAPNEQIVKLWDLLLSDPRVKPAGLGCRDTLRLEMGYPLYGQDIDADHSPIAAGFEKYVDFFKEFIGKAALLEEKSSGSKEHLICFKADSRRSPRHNFAIYAQGKQIGVVTSGSFSPSLGVGIGMGYVSGNCSVGDKLVVKEAATEIPVTVVKKPFIGKTSL